MTGKALAAGLEQLTGTADPPKHLENLSMHTRARSLVMEMFGQIDRDLNLSDSPEGDVRTESQQIFEDYAKRVADRKLGRSGILTGLLPIDLYTSGFQNGDLVLFPAYTSEGKTQLCVHLAHHCAVHQRKNVYMATSETIRPQVIRRIIARHSKEPMFGLPDGINSKWLKMGDIPQELLDSYKLVVQDFTTNPAYGKLHVAQIPRGSTIAQLEQRVQSVQRSWDVDLVIIDYLALLRPERHRQSGWEEKSDILKDAKMLAVTFAEGRGVPVVSPWQFSRSGYETALRTGYYKLSDLSESAEAEKSSDLIIPLLRMAPPEDPRRVELKAQVLKNRDGETAEAISLLCDYTTSTFSVPQSNASMEALLEN
jgi:replicative DNA helicase